MASSRPAATPCLCLEAPPTVQEALDCSQHWDAEVHRLIKEYAAAKLALSTRRDRIAALRRFSLKEAALLAAMEHRHRCQAVAEQMRKQAAFHR